MKRSHRLDEVIVHTFPSDHDVGPKALRTFGISLHRQQGVVMIDDALRDISRHCAGEEVKDRVLQRCPPANPSASSISSPV